MTIELTIPPGIVMADNSELGWERAVFDSVSKHGTEGDSLTSEARNRRSYVYDPALFGGNSGKQAKWDALMRDCALGTSRFWIPEVFEETHHKLLCGPPGDDVRTTFPISCIDPTVLTVLAGLPGLEAWQDPSGWAAHASANLLSDDQYNAIAGDTGSEEYGSCVVAQDLGVAITGNSSFKIAPTGSVGNVGVTLTGEALIAVTPGQEYTSVAHFFGAGDFYSSIRWYKSDKNPSSTPVSVSAAPVTSLGTAVVSNLITATAPVDAAYAARVPYRSTVSALKFFIGATSLSPGDYARVHIPSLAPGLIEFASALAKPFRPLCTATGRRLSRCSMVVKGKDSCQIRRGKITRVTKKKLVERAENRWS